MNEWRPPRELNVPIPRPVRMSDEAACAVYTLILVPLSIFISMSLFLIPLAVRDYRETKILRERGVDAIAEFTGKYILRDKKNGRNYYVIEYMFVPERAKQQPTSVVRRSFTTSESEYYAFYNGSKVPVIYDPLQPQLSYENYDDSVRKQDPAYAIKCVLIFYLIVLPMVVMIGRYLALFSYRREKYLLEHGVAAAATIIEEEEYYDRRRWSKVTYRFTDASGATVTGMRRKFPPKSWENKSEEYARYRARFLENLTVLYDPQYSANNLLYPATWASIA